MEGKGGWTYVLLPSHQPKTGLPFGWYVVKGKIEGVEVNQLKLWPTKNGELFLSLNATMRKKIGKNVGDIVSLELIEDVSEVEIPEDFISCLLDCPPAYDFFQTISDTSKKQYVDWVYRGKHFETKANRMAKAIEKLSKQLKYHEKENE